MVTAADQAKVPRPVVLLFPGQGTQHGCMAAGLYDRVPAFTEAADEVLRLLGRDGPAIRDDWLSDCPRVPIDDVRRAQPLLFMVDYALAAMLLDLGVRPVALLGHSAGELAAATVAGVFTLDEAVGLMAERVTHAARTPAGGMLAVAASPGEIASYLTGEVALAAVNAPAQTMLAGPAEPLARAERRLRSAGLVVRPVLASTAFHSPSLAPAAAATERFLSSLRLRPPAAVPVLYSGYTGRPLAAGQARSPAFWARQLTDTVYFGPALDWLLSAEGDVLLVEAGPRQTLTTLARRLKAVRSGTSSVIPLLPASPRGPEDDRQAVLAAVAALESEGHQLRPQAVQAVQAVLDAAGPLPAARP
jgi:[acyl-carrier-protein] S-malonyltransferase